MVLSLTMGCTVTRCSELHVVAYLEIHSGATQGARHCKPVQQTLSRRTCSFRACCKHCFISYGAKPLHRISSASAGGQLAHTRPAVAARTNERLLAAGSTWRVAHAAPERTWQCRCIAATRKKTAQADEPQARPGREHNTNPSSRQTGGYSHVLAGIRFKFRVGKLGQDFEQHTCTLPEYVARADR